MVLLVAFVRLVFYCTRLIVQSEQANISNSDFTPFLHPNSSPSPHPYPKTKYVTVLYETCLRHSLWCSLIFGGMIVSKELFSVFAIFNYAPLLWSAAAKFIKSFRKRFRIWNAQVWPSEMAGFVKNIAENIDRSPVNVGAANWYSISLLSRRSCNILPPTLPLTHSNLSDYT